MNLDKHSVGWHINDIVDYLKLEGKTAQLAEYQIRSLLQRIEPLLSTPSALPAKDFTPCTVCVCHNPVMSGISCVHCAATQAQPQESAATLEQLLLNVGITNEAGEDCAQDTYEQVKALLAAEHTRGAREELEALKKDGGYEWQDDQILIKNIDDRLQQLTDKEPK